MSRIKTLLFLLFLNLGLIGNSFEPHRDLRIDLSKETALYYKNFGYKRAPEEFRPFLYSAIRVARMFPMYPASGEKDRMLRFFELGGLESFWQKDFLVLNVPGAKYSNGVVKRVSVDFSVWGVNEDSVPWTYVAARCIQQGKPFPKHVGSWYPTKEFREMMKGAKIPRDLRLRKIDLSIVTAIKSEYAKQKRLTRDPEKLRKAMKSKMPAWEENTLDDISSALIYRILEELDRKSRGWKYGHELYSENKHALYRHLDQFIEEE